LEKATDQKNYQAIDARIRAAQDKIATFDSQKKNAEAFLERVKSEAAAYLAEETKKAEAKEAEDSKAWFEAYDDAVTKAKTLKKDAEDA